MSQDEQGQGPATNESISRRHFLKMAGIAGAAVGAAGGLGGLLAACGEETTTTTAATTATAAPTSSGASTTAAPTTSISTSAEAGREIKVGYVIPQTGNMASFGQPSTWIMGHWKEALAGGVVAGDGKLHQVKVEGADCQSDSNRAAQVGGDLIQNSQVDVVFAAGSPDVCNPVADQSEAFGTPSISDNVPLEPWFFGRGGTPDKPFKWSWSVSTPFFGLIGSWVQMWDQLPTNKKVGMFFANSTDGMAFSDEKTGAPFYAKQGGYEVFMPSLYAPGTEDFTSVIAEFKKAGVEIAASIAVPPDFTNFWRQCAQQGFQPKIMTCGLALLFEETVKAIGPSAIGLTCEDVWHPSWPYKDALTGMTCQQLADDYEAKEGRQWTSSIMQVGMMEIFIDAVKRTKNLDDKAELSAAIGSANLMTSQGPVDFTAPVGSDNHPVPNATSAATGGGQWRKGTKWEYEMAYLASTYVPGGTAGVTPSKLEPIQY